MRSWRDGSGLLASVFRPKRVCVTCAHPTRRQIGSTMALEFREAVRQAAKLANSSQYSAAAQQGSRGEAELVPHCGRVFVDDDDGGREVLTTTTTTHERATLISGSRRGMEL